MARTATTGKKRGGRTGSRRPKKWMGRARESMEKRGTVGAFTRWSGGKVTAASIKRGLAAGGKRAKQAAFAKAARTIARRKRG